MAPIFRLLLASFLLFALVSAQDSDPTTMFLTLTMTSTMESSSTIPTSSAIATHTVLMGQDGFSLTPQNTNASVGDIIEYRFYYANHSVAEAAYLSPCQPLEVTTAGAQIGFWSGFEPVAKEVQEINRPIYRVRVNDTEPIWFYCSAPDACTKNGMLGVINPNSTQNLAAQLAAAKTATVELSPGDPLPVEGASPTASLPPSSTSTVLAVPGPRSTGSALSAGAIAGISVGGATVVIILVLVFFLWGKLKGLSSHLKYSHSTNITRNGETKLYKDQPDSTSPPYYPSFSVKDDYADTRSPPLTRDSWQTVPNHQFVSVRAHSPEVQQGYGLMSQIHEDSALHQHDGYMDNNDDFSGGARWSGSGVAPNGQIIRGEMGGHSGQMTSSDSLTHHSDAHAQNFGLHELDAHADTIGFAKTSSG